MIDLAFYIDGLRQIHHPTAVATMMHTQNQGSENACCIVAPMIDLGMYELLTIFRDSLFRRKTVGERHRRPGRVQSAVLVFRAAVTVQSALTLRQVVFFPF